MSDSGSAPPRMGEARAPRGLSNRRAPSGRRAGALAAALALGLLAGCGPIIRNHGYVPDAAALASIEVGVDDRAAVAEKAGQPITTGVMEGSDFYYVASQRRTLGFRAPTEADRRVVVVSFDGSGRVSNVERFGIERGRIVPLSRRVTESDIRGTGFIGQLLNSVGRLRAEDVVD